MQRSIWMFATAMAVRLFGGLLDILPRGIREAYTLRPRRLWYPG
jgi:hypothetical protein